MAMYTRKVTAGTYDITEIDSLEHDTSEGTYNSLVMIDSTHFILAYSGADEDGFIKTFSIDNDHDTITEIDSLEHATGTGRYNSLVMIDSTHFMLAYQGDDNDGFIKVFSIDGSYDNITQLTSLEHETSSNSYNSLVMIDSTHFILAYAGVGDDGFIKTFSIDGSYNVTQLDSLEHDGNRGDYNSLVMIDSTHFILAYDGAGAKISTFSIDGSYNITEIDSIEHDSVLGQHHSLVMIDSTHFMLAYRGASFNGYVKTFSIDGSYDNITQIDSLQHDTSGQYNSLSMIDSTHAILACYNGYVKTFGFDGSYDNITEMDSLQHDTSLGQSNSLVMIDSSHSILAYEGGDSDGYIKTFSFETIGYKWQRII